MRQRIALRVHSKATTNGGKCPIGNTFMEVEAMRQVYGDYRVEQYSIVVQPSDRTVRVEFFNNETHHMQKSGRLMVQLK